MGCGASTTGSAAPTANDDTSQPKPDAQRLPNGHILTSALKGSNFKLTTSHKSNTVGPAPISSESVAEPNTRDVVHEIMDDGEVITVKRILKLTSIEEPSAEKKSRDVTSQTMWQRRRRRKGSNQATQTDFDLFPEDELEDMLMIDDDTEDEIEGRYSLNENESDQLNSSDDESVTEVALSCGAESGKTDVATQSGPWICSKATQTRLSFPAISARLHLESASDTENSPSTAPNDDEGRQATAKTLTIINNRKISSLTEALTQLDTNSSAISSSTGQSLREASVQTDMLSTERHPNTECSATNDAELHPRPPVSRKKEVIPSLSIFRDIDIWVHDTPDKEWQSPSTLADYLCKDAATDLFSVRAIFVWIALNVRYESKQKGGCMTPLDVIMKCEGVDIHYCSLFEAMCSSLGITVKRIRGFIKGSEHRPGYKFDPNADEMHEWNAVHVLGSWRLIDTCRGSGSIDSSGQFNQKLNEHYFLPDPEVLIWSHYPCHEDASWQLIEKPISLSEFNALPRVTPQFFEYNMHIRSKQSHPYEFKVQTEIQIAAHETMRYKYKLYPADQAENESLNHFAFCQLQENRLVGSFIVTPPLETRYYLKVYAKEEREMLEGTDSSSLPAVATFLLICTRARKHLQPFPLNELPWGPTQAFYDFKMRIMNQTGPVISTWGGKRKLVIETCEIMLIQHQMFDADGMEMDIRTYILKEENGRKITFTIAPPHASKFKFLLFGMPKPKQNGHWRLPLLASFLVDCKLAQVLPKKDPDPPPVPRDAATDVNFANRKLSKMSSSRQ